MRFLLAVLAISAGAHCTAVAADKSKPPVEAWVAPPSIFPPDGNFPKGGAKAYKPFPVHKGFVPTRNKDGSHTGINEHNDC